MKISNIKFTKIKTDNSDSVRGIATIVIDDVIAIHGIKVIKGQNDNLFVSMPNYKSDGKFIDIVHPITAEARKNLMNAILKEYEKAKKEVNISK